MTTGNTIALTRWTLVGKVMALHFAVLSRLLIAFFPRSKHLLISWLQSPSAVILEPPKKKSSTVYPSICHEVMGLDAMILVFWMLSFKPTFSLSYFIFIKRFFSSLLSAIRDKSRQSHFILWRQGSGWWVVSNMERVLGWKWESWVARKSTERAGNPWNLSLLNWSVTSPPLPEPWTSYPCQLNFLFLLSEAFSEFLPTMKGFPCPLKTHIPTIKKTNPTQPNSGSQSWLHARIS